MQRDDKSAFTFPCFVVWIGTPQVTKGPRPLEAGGREEGGRGLLCLRAHRHVKLFPASHNYTLVKERAKHAPLFWL
jgi:hypothetical protein